MFELVVLVHLGFITWVITGGFLAIRWWWLVLLHLPTLVWGVLLEWYGWVCPLTPLENTLRTGRDMAVYDTGFIENYIVPVVYPEGLTREIQMAMAVVLVLINAVAYWLVIHRNFLKR
ncbi:MAG: DUF2784 domain-containing protein [Gammaproteobacteria bacterium]|nr:DUF2784 domain-containing protein [Gammaproteobacteria bacterium]